MSQGLDGVRKAAKERKQERFTALLHHLNVELLRDSFYALQRKASPGVDGVTWQEYETGLEDRLVDLHSRVHRGAYRAKPSRRVFIPKADGRLHYNSEAVVPWFFREGPAFVTNSSGSEKLHRILHRLLASGAYGRLLATLRRINGSD